MGEIYIHGYKLVLTCYACPEQYDVFDPSGKQVGYLRLRHGYFRADCPDAGDATVYSADCDGDGMFREDERLPHLKAAVEAIIKWQLKQMFKSDLDY